MKTIYSLMLLAGILFTSIAAQAHAKAPPEKFKTEITSVIKAEVSTAIDVACPTIDATIHVQACPALDNQLCLEKPAEVQMPTAYSGDVRYDKSKRSSLCNYISLAKSASTVLKLSIHGLIRCRTFDC